MDANLRCAHQNELENLLNLYQHLHTDDAPLPENPTLHQIWEDILSDPKMNCLVANLGGMLVASFVLVIVPNLTRGARPYGLIENVVTHPNYRRRGIATYLLQHALQIAWNKNCYKVMLLTGSKSEGIRQFYEQAGFTKGVKTRFVARP